MIIIMIIIIIIMIEIVIMIMVIIMIIIIFLKCFELHTKAKKKITKSTITGKKKKISFHENLI